MLLRRITVCRAHFLTRGRLGSRTARKRAGTAFLPSRCSFVMLASAFLSLGVSSLEII